MICTSIPREKTSRYWIAFIEYSEHWTRYRTIVFLTNIIAQWLPLISGKKSQESEMNNYFELIHFPWRNNNTKSIFFVAWAFSTLNENAPLIMEFPFWDGFEKNRLVLKFFSIVACRKNWIPFFLPSELYDGYTFQQTKRTAHTFFFLLAIMDVHQRVLYKIINFETFRW